MEENNNPNSNPVENNISTSVTPSRSMPSVRQLLEESWHLFTKKVLKILLILVYVFVAAVAIYLAAGLIIGLMALVTGGVNLAALSNIFDSPLFLGGAAVTILAAVIGAVIVNIMGQAALLLALAEKDESVSAFSLFKKGWIYVLPLFVVGIIQFFIVFGSLFLFIIPVIIVSIFLAFTSYVVVLEGKRGLSAIKMSASIVQQHFGAIIGRFILYFLLVVAIMILLGTLSAISEEVAVLVGLVRFVFNFTINWFGLVYTYLIYKHARAVYDESKPASVTWMWIVSGLGWIIAALLITLAIRSIGNIDPAEIMQKSLEENRRMDFEQSGEYAPEFPSEMGEQEFFEMFDQETQQQLRQLQQIEDGNQI